MDTNVILIICTIIAGIFSILALLIGLIALVKVCALERSTHTVHLTPVNEEVDRINQEYLSVQDQEDSWATTEQELAKQQKMFREELEDKLPEFYEKEKEIISF